MTPPWRALLKLTNVYVERLEALRPPLLLVLVDGATALVAVWPGRESLEHHSRFPGMPPLTAEQWLTSTLLQVSKHYPAPASSVELYAQWPGNPPRRERIGRVARRLEVTHESHSLARPA